MKPKIHYDVHEFIKAVNKAAKLKPKVNLTYLKETFYDYAYDGTLVWMDKYAHTSKYGDDDHAMSPYDISVRDAICEVLTSLGEEEILLHFWW